MSLVNPKLNSTAQISPAKGGVGEGHSPQPSCFLCSPLRLTGRPGVEALEWSILSACWPRRALCMYFMPQSLFRRSAAAFFLRQTAAGKFFFFSSLLSKRQKKSFSLLSSALKKDRNFFPCTVASSSLLPGEKSAAAAGWGVGGGWIWSP